MTDNPRSKPIPCARCGVRREARKTSHLCADCRSVLTREQQKAWAA